MNFNLKSSNQFIKMKNYKKGFHFHQKCTLKIRVFANFSLKLFPNF